jgi:CelD/BcsL family acetyltransferase involved in cellulose biosynthesis
MGDFVSAVKKAKEKERRREWRESERKMMGGGAEESGRVPALWSRAAFYSLFLARRGEKGRETPRTSMR